MELAFAISFIFSDKEASISSVILVRYPKIVDVLKKFIDNKIVYNESGVNDKISHVELSDFDKERLKSWTSTDNPDFFQIHFIGGCTYGLGVSNHYEIKNSREEIEWNSFFEKLLKLGGDFHGQ